MLDYWEKKCADGDLSSCARLEESRTDVEKLARLEQRAVEFGKSIAPGTMLRNGKPALDSAYVQVMQAFIHAENELGNNEISYDKDAIDYCAGHFHEYWTNKKLWWPTNAAGNPDWTGIYFYIVDHYYGICLRRYFN